MALTEYVRKEFVGAMKDGLVHYAIKDRVILAATSMDSAKTEPVYAHKDGMEDIVLYVSLIPIVP